MVQACAWFKDVCAWFKGVCVCVSLEVCVCVSREVWLLEVERRQVRRRRGEERERRGEEKRGRRGEGGSLLSSLSMIMTMIIRSFGFLSLHAQL